jgi:hypothetical protein
MTVVCEFEEKRLDARKGRGYTVSFVLMEICSVINSAAVPKWEEMNRVRKIVANRTLGYILDITSNC